MALAHDKKLHFIAGLCIALFPSLILYFAFREAFPAAAFFAKGVWSGLVGLALALLAGIFKEIRDIKKGTPEMADFLFTALGGLIGAVPVMFF